MAIQAILPCPNQTFHVWLLSDKQASGVQALLTVTAKVEAYVALPASLVQRWLYVLPIGFGYISFLISKHVVTVDQHKPVKFDCKGKTSS